MEILTFKKFNEGLWNDVKNFFFRGGSSEPKTEYAKDLKDYNLSLHPSSDQQSMTVKHTKWTKLKSETKVVAEININTTLKTNYPVWDLYVYFYESELPKEKNYKLPQGFPNQNEQPYGRAKESFASETDNALKVFLDWWKNNTNSGRAKNPRYKVKF
jgi:hypothetical protein